MAFAKKTETDFGTIGIWELSETVAQLQNKFYFTPSEKTEFEKLKIEKRQKEFLAVRMLIEKLIGEKTELLYSNTGQPQLKNKDLSISISHSAEYAAVFISDKKAGIDIENIFRDTQKVARRFLTGPEMKMTETSRNPELARIICWSAKEAIYKCTMENSVEFNRQIKIHPFTVENNGQLSGQLETNRKLELYDLWYFFYGNNVVVYCVER